MKAGGGREKGNGFERKIAKVIWQAFTKFKITSEDCYRTPASGGHRFAKKVDPGDLTLSPRLRTLFPFSVECKFYQSLDWGAMLTDRDGTFGKWWDQCKAACTDDTHPLLVFKENRGDVYCMFSEQCNPVTASCAARYLRTMFNKDIVRVMRFDDFLDIQVQRGERRLRKQA